MDAPAEDLVTSEVVVMAVDVAVALVRGPCLGFCDGDASMSVVPLHGGGRRQCSAPIVGQSSSVASRLSISQETARPSIACSSCSASSFDVRRRLGLVPLAHEDEVSDALGVAGSVLCGMRKRSSAVSEPGNFSEQIRRPLSVETSVVGASSACACGAGAAW